VTSGEERRQAAEKSRRMTARANDTARYYRIMDDLFAPLLGGKSKPTPPPPATPVSENYVEWSPLLLALNRVVRAYLDGEPLEGWALDLLAQQPQQQVDDMADSVRTRLSLRPSAGLRIRNERLEAIYYRSFFDKRLRQDTLFAVQTAVAERRGLPATPLDGGRNVRAVIFSGLPLTIAGSAGEPERARR
jgi:hypothetical protein